MQNCKAGSINPAAVSPENISALGESTGNHMAGDQSGQPPPHGSSFGGQPELQAPKCSKNLRAAIDNTHIHRKKGSFTTAIQTHSKLF